jgi:signal transduction histidine kinase
MATMTAERPLEQQPEAAAPPASGRASSVLALHVVLAAFAGFVVTVIWAMAGPPYFWPVWVWLGGAITVALHAIGWRTARSPDGPRRAVEAHALVSVSIGLLLVVLWALTDGPVFWPAWPLLGLAAALLLHALLAALGWVGPHPREEELAERVDELTRTRRGALDVQATELRRIERDLHDGAQARLVALSMQLGRAEEKLADRPEIAELVRAARAEAGSAIAELRDLARGIAPPVLADRGLAAAIESLGQRSAIPVTVDVEIGERPPPMVETAAYFVVAEALTNAAKHAGRGVTARVRARVDDGVLAIEVADTGAGGADPEGSGLTGLRHRVEALDGRLRVESPPGGGTIVNAELPCVS